MTLPMLVVLGCSFSGSGVTGASGDVPGTSTGGSTSTDGGTSAMPGTTGTPTTGMPSGPTTDDATAGTTESVVTTEVEGTSTTTVGTTEEVDASTTAATTEEGTSTSTGDETTAEPCELKIWYLDADGDGYGLDNMTNQACEQPDGYAPDDGDCDDGVKAVNPGVKEKCDNVDNDCDGLKDEYTPENKECGPCTLVPDDAESPTRVYLLCHETPLAWDAAVNSCVSLTAVLSKDDDMAEHDFLVAAIDDIDPMKGRWWLGARKVGGLDLTYTWLDGTAVSAVDPRWAVGFGVPINGRAVGVLSSGVMNGGKWVDGPKADVLPYVCEQDLTP